MSDPEKHKFIQTKYEMGGRQGRRADEPKWNRAIFSVPKKKKKKGNRNAPSFAKK